MLSVTDSFSSSGNDGTPTNSPRYSLGDRAFNTIGTIADSITLGISRQGRAAYALADSVTLGYAATGAGPVVDTGTSVIGSDYVRIRDANSTYLTTNYNTANRSSIRIAAGAPESNTVGVANKNYGQPLLPPGQSQ